jgi:hypothetical protein
MSVKVIPLVVGRCRLPRLRVLLHEPGVVVEPTEEQQEGIAPEDKVTELEILVEEATRLADEEQAEQRGGLEEELRAARLNAGEEEGKRFGGDFSVLVMPR